jgi:FHA domain
VALLSRVEEGRNVLLESEHTVGRSPECRLTINAPYVSGQHALLRWTGERWEIRDLGSTNGTFLDGARLAPGESRPLAPGLQLGFGHADQLWRVVDVDPPRIHVVPEDGGPVVYEEQGLIALPSDSNPLATIYRDASGRWKLERPAGDSSEIQPGKSFEVSGRRFRLSSPEILPPTAMAHRRPELSSMWLRFAVTRNEEHVEITLDDGYQRQALPPRKHNYLLLLLGRRRLEDAAANHPPTACGWMFRDDLSDALAEPPTQLNIDIFRIRQQFAGLGLPDAAHIIERRATTTEIRIGVGQLEIASL